jgi:hypothetical protein
MKWEHPDVILGGGGWGGACDSNGTCHPCLQGMVVDTVSPESMGGRTAAR